MRPASGQRTLNHPRSELRLDSYDPLPLLRAAVAERYEVGDRIGQGGMATVYRVLDREHSRIVALKLLDVRIAQFVGPGRFRREVGILQRLDHPNILRLLDAGERGDLVWYTMPLVEGASLRDRLQVEGPLPIPEAVSIAGQILDALAYAHAANVVHRDIKPANILLGEGRVFVADFGVAGAIERVGGDTLSSTGIVVGTPAYMSPEQAGGGGRVDGRTDLYATGCVLFEMLSGAPPFTGSSAQAVQARHRHEAPPRIEIVRPRVPPDLVRVIDTALAKEPADRYRSAGAMREPLDRAGSAALVAAPACRGRRRGWLTAGAAAALALAAWLLRGAGGLEPDQSRYVVMPFQVTAPAVPDLMASANSAALLVGAMELAWRDVRLVTRAQLENELAAAGIPRTLASAAGVARRLDAGRMIWGEIAARANSLVITAWVYATGEPGDPIRRARFTVPAPDGPASIDGAAVLAGFDGLARELLVGAGREGGEAAAGAGTAFSTAALAKLRGDSARAVWDLDTAEARYREALGIDPEYAGAALALAQVGEWLERPTAGWRPLIAAALARPERLGPRERLAAEGLQDLGDEAYDQACDAYRRLIRRDSLDGEAWFGLGECQLHDEVVVLDPASPSGFAFRSSFQAAATAYLRALELAPLAHRAPREMAAGRLFRVLRTSVALRSGVLAGDPGARFLAWPALLADSAGYVPYPWQRFTGPDRPPIPASAEALYARNAEVLTRAVEEWTGVFPSSPRAWEARASVLERLGSLGAGPDGALGAVTRARGREPDSLGSIRLAADQVRLLLKAGAFGGARRLGDSLLRATPDPGPAGALLLAPVAALLGDRDRTLALMVRGASEWSFQSQEGEEVRPSRAIAEDALRLYVYGVLGGPADSVDRIEARVVAGVRATVAEPDRSRYLMALLAEADLYAFPLFGLRTAHRLPEPGSALALQAAWARGDTARVRVELLEAARAKQARAMRDVSPESVFLDAWLWARLGDSARARGLLERSIDALPSLSAGFFARPQGPAFLVRGMGLLAELTGGRDSSGGGGRLGRALGRLRPAGGGAPDLP